MRKLLYGLKILFETVLILALILVILTFFHEADVRYKLPTNDPNKIDLIELYRYEAGTVVKKQVTDKNRISKIALYIESLDMSETSGEGPLEDYYQFPEEEANYYSYHIIFHFKDREQEIYVIENEYIHRAGEKYYVINDKNKVYEIQHLWSETK